MQQKIAKTIQICSEMLEDRGYVKKSQTDDNIIQLIYKNEKEQIIVFILYKDKINMNIIRKLLDIADMLKISHLIIVYNDSYKNSITSKLKHRIEELMDKNVEFFPISSLQYNITKHVLVPKHVLATEEEEKDIKSKYKINDLPVILAQYDPVCCYYNFKPGSIIKIIRKKDINFRVVK